MGKVEDQVRAMQGTQWQPSKVDLERGRQAMREALKRHLPVSEFAQYTKRSPQQVYRDIAMNRLLALSPDPRGIGKRVPSWQLAPGPRRLTQQVLAAAVDIDAWSVYQALSLPAEALDGKSPVDAAREPRANINALAAIVCAMLGLQLA